MTASLQRICRKTRVEHLIASTLCPAMLLIMALSVCPSPAAVPVAPTLDAIHISSITTVACEGTVDHGNTLSWQQSGISLHDPPLDAGGIYSVWFDEEGNPVYGWTADPALADLLDTPVPPGEVRYTAGYSATLLAGQGITELEKNMEINSGEENSGNVDTSTLISFNPSNGHGDVAFSEDIAIDAAAAHRTMENSLSCTFLPDDCPFIPPFCEVVEMGSSSDISRGSVMTSARTRFIDSPGAPGVSMDYTVASGDQAFSNDPRVTTGSIEAYVRAWLGEGRMRNITPQHSEDIPDNPPGYVPEKASEIAYSEQTTAHGAIIVFSKDMHYRSGIRG